MNRAWYADSIERFVTASRQTIVDRLAGAASERGFPPLPSQIDAWRGEIELLQRDLASRRGTIYLEFSIPRMGTRADVVLLLGRAIFVVEFKVGERQVLRSDLDQVWDYALDLKNFHETSHDQVVVPILLITERRRGAAAAPDFSRGDKTCPPIPAGREDISDLLNRIVSMAGEGEIDRAWWESGRYRPTPTIIEAARALYNNHSVLDIARNEAGENLAVTSGAVAGILESARAESRKSICFVTGVPGAGKTLVGLDTATRFMDPRNELHSVYLSGNGPLVKVLREALARDQAGRGGGRLSDERRKVQAFIQNVHHFRDEYLDDPGAPAEHVALFDEAQRAWDLAETCRFMQQKKKRPGFDRSEPEFLLSCLDRHKDWAAVVCLVGGGQEINRGEAGIGEWIASLNRTYPDWHVHVSPHLKDREYGAGAALSALSGRKHVDYREELHLGVSMRSFRADRVSHLVKHLLDLDPGPARETLAETLRSYPIVLTRKLDLAKRWLRSQARGSERYGIVVSSNAERLRPHAISVRAPMDPIHWFLAGKEDVRSSYYLEDVATEFDVQGLELDWACVTWDADFRYSREGWQHLSFCGDRWTRVRKPERMRYQTNAYRVLLTRARQGMVVVVPEGDAEDPTRASEFYDPTYAYLRDVGIPELS